MITLTKNGLKKKVATGYSWKSLFFGCLYPFFRGDQKGGIRHFIYASVTFGVSLFFVPFFYNKRYIKQLIEEGYEPLGESDIEYLVRKIDYLT